VTRRKGTPPYVEPFKPCEMCSGGWLINHELLAYRCICWRIYQEKHAPADRRQQPREMSRIGDE